MKWLCIFALVPLMSCGSCDGVNLFGPPCETDQDCLDQEDIFNSCGLAEAGGEAICCVAGSIKCACDANDECEDDLVCYDTTNNSLAAPIGKYCQLGGLDGTFGEPL